MVDLDCYHHYCKIDDPLVYSVQGATVAMMRSVPDILHVHERIHKEHVWIFPW